MGGQPNPGATPKYHWSVSHASQFPTFYTTPNELFGRRPAIESDYSGNEPFIRLTLSANPDAKYDNMFLVRRLSPEQQRQQGRKGPLEEKLADTKLVIAKRLGNKAYEGQVMEILVGYFFDGKYLYGRFSEQRSEIHGGRVNALVRGPITFSDLYSIREFRNKAMELLMPLSTRHWFLRRIAMLKKVIMNSDLPEINKQALQELLDK